MAGFFLLNATVSFVESKYINLFSGGSAKAAKARRSSGIEQLGWYGQVVMTASSPADMKNQFNINLYEFLDFLLVKKVENKFISSL